MGGTQLGSRLDADPVLDVVDADPVLDVDDHMVGRDAAIVDLIVAIGGCSGRLVTVVGAGGVGKTRVSNELARGETVWQAACAAGATLDRDAAIEAALQTVQLRIVA